MSERAAIRIIAHRGRHDRHRENSLAAFREAMHTGADAAEMDVRLTRDRVPVLAHNRVQWRRAVPHVVSRSSAHGLSFLARLEDLLTQQMPTDRATPIVLDVKRGEELATVAAYCLERADPSTISLWCRDKDELRKLSRHDEFAELSLLPDGYSRPQILTYLDDAAACGSSAVSLHREVLGTDLVAAAHERGLRAYAWIRSLGDHAGAVLNGVDGLVTDWVDEARRAAGRNID